MSFCIVGQLVLWSAFTCPKSFSRNYENEDLDSYIAQYLCNDLPVKDMDIYFFISRCKENKLVFSP